MFMTVPCWDCLNTLQTTKLFMSLFPVIFFSKPGFKDLSSFWVFIGEIKITPLWLVTKHKKQCRTVQLALQRSQEIVLLCPCLHLCHEMPAIPALYPNTVYGCQALHFTHLGPLEAAIKGNYSAPYFGTLCYWQSKAGWEAAADWKQFLLHFLRN